MHMQIGLTYAGPGTVAVQWVTWPQDDAAWSGDKPDLITAFDATYRVLHASRKLIVPASELPYFSSSHPSHCEKIQAAGLRSVVQYGFQPGPQYAFSVQGERVGCYELGDYQSGALHSVILGGAEGPLPPNTTVYYRVGDPDQEMSAEFSFVTAPRVGPQSLPYRLGLVADVGQTEHSVSTLDHLMAHEPHSILFAGDLSYADGYQPRWDSWARMMQPLTATSVFMYTEGNHEQEHSDGPSDWLAYTSGFTSHMKAAGHRRRCTTATRWRGFTS